MIKTEFYRTREDGVNLYKTYSDQNVMIHGGFPEGNYVEAIDPEGMNRVYTETNIPIESEEISNEEALDIIMGRDEDETT